MFLSLPPEGELVALRPTEATLAISAMMLLVDAHCEGHAIETCRSLDWIRRKLGTAVRGGDI